MLGQHAQSAAYFHTQRVHPFYHFENAVEVAIVPYFAPRGSHAEAGSSTILCSLSSFDHLPLLEQRLNPYGSGIAGCLWAVGAIFRATSRLYGKQTTDLHFPHSVKFPMHIRCFEDQGKQRPVVDFPDLNK